MRQAILTPPSLTFVFWIPREEEKEKEAENLFEEVMAENFPNLGKKTDIWVQETQRVSNKMKPKKSTPKHIKCQ